MMNLASQQAGIVVATKEVAIEGGRNYFQIVDEASDSINPEAEIEAKLAALLESKYRLVTLIEMHAVD